MKKKKPSPTAARHLRCPYCGAPVSIRSAAEIYNDPQLATELYVCNNYPKCDTYVGVHKGTRIPYGSLANRELRNLRIKAHRKFDLLWQSEIFSRDNAYRWLSDFLCLDMSKAHIGMLGEYYCRKLIDECDRILEQKEKLVEEERQ